MKVHACRVGPIPKVANKDEEAPGGFKTFLGPGDHLFATICSVPKTTIAVTSDMATELAEKALCSTQQRRQNSSHTTCMTSKRSWPKNPLICCQRNATGTMLLNCSLDRSHLHARSTYLHQMNKYNWTPSCKRTSAWVGSVLPSHQWPCLCFLLRRKMVCFAWSRTTMHSM